MRVPKLFTSHTLRTGGTQSFQPSGYPEDWWDSVTGSQVGGTTVVCYFGPIGTVDWTQSFRTARNPEHWWESALSAAQGTLRVGWTRSLFATRYPGLVGFSHFSRPGIPRTARTHYALYTIHYSLYTVYDVYTFT